MWTAWSWYMLCQWALASFINRFLIQPWKNSPVVVAPCGLAYTEIRTHIYFVNYHNFLYIIVMKSKCLILMILLYIDLQV